MKASLTAGLTIAGLALFCATANAAPAINGIETTFKKGDGGWVGRIAPNGIGVSFVDDTVGNRRPSYRTQYDDFLKNGLRWYNTTRRWTGDYSVVPSFTFGVDVNAFNVQEGLFPITRDLMVYFLDFQNPPKGFDSISVGVKIGTLQVGQGWQKLTVTIPDTQSTELPDGWIGTGDTDAQGNPMLPAGRTFAEVMSHVDQIAIQTVRQPNITALDSFDVAIDNPYISANCPGALSQFSLEKPAQAAATGSPFHACE